MKNVSLLMTSILLGCSSGTNIDHRLVYTDDGAIQCQSDGLSVEETAQVLVDAGIDVISSHCGYLSGIAVAAQCGLGDININIHGINVQNLPDAQELGFEPVSSLMRNDDIGYVVTECPNES